MNQKLLKPLLKWGILGGVFFFLLQTLRSNWHDITSIHITAAGWSSIVGATGVTLLAHIWSGWVWGWILAELTYGYAQGNWSVLTYLKTNIAKYLPGNIWHFYGRVMAAKAIAIPVEASTVSVIMEALLMAAAALMVGLLSSQQLNLPLQILFLLVGLLSVHPKVLNPILKRLKTSKLKSVMQLGKRKEKNEENYQALPIGGSPTNHHPSPTTHPSLSAAQLKRYPVLPFLGELGFLGLRSLGFMGVAIALTPIPWTQFPAVLSGFSLAWMLGLVIPGAPGGIGVFEATAIALLSKTTILSPGTILSTVALYRLVSTIAEAIGALVAWIDEQRNQKQKR